MIRVFGSKNGIFNKDSSVNKIEGGSQRNSIENSRKSVPCLRLTTLAPNDTWLMSSQILPASLRGHSQLKAMRHQNMHHPRGYCTGSTHELTRSLLWLWYQWFVPAFHRAGMVVARGSALGNSEKCSRARRARKSNSGGERDHIGTDVFQVLLVALLD